MAAISLRQHVDLPQASAPDGVNPDRRFDFPTCRTMADIRARAQIVSAFRKRNWPRPSAPLPAPPQVTTSPVAVVERMQATPAPTRIADVLAVTAAHFNITVDDLTSDSRRYRVVRPRQIAEYVAHKLTGRSYPYIAGKLAAGRDHTMTLHSVRTVAARIDAGDARLAADIDAIVARLGVVHD
jgi:hypothetical protein